MFRMNNDHKSKWNFNLVANPINCIADSNRTQFRHFILRCLVIAKHQWGKWVKIIDSFLNLWVIMVASGSTSASHYLF